MVDILAQHTLTIRCEDDVIVVRRKVREIAHARKFDTFATAAITTATSELTRNAWMHGGGGQAHIEELGDGGRFGIRITFADNGPGIANMDRVMAGGYSTANSMGLGLSGSRRLVDDFQIESQPGRGTKVIIVKWNPY